MGVRRKLAEFPQGMRKTEVGIPQDTSENWYPQHWGWVQSFLKAWKSPMHIIDIDLFNDPASLVS